MSENGQAPTGVDAILDEILAPLRGQLAELRSQKQDHLDAIAEIDVEIRKLERVEKAADPETTKPKKGPRQNSTRISDATLAAVRAAIQENVEVDEPFTVDDVEGWTTSIGISKSTVPVVLRLLRDDESIRLIGRVPPQPGHRGLTPYAYRLMS